jgi:sorting nexin-17
MFIQFPFFPQNEAEIPLNNAQRGHTVTTPSSIKKKMKDKISTTVLFRNGKDSVHNEAFEGIGDDDL